MTKSKAEIAAEVEGRRQREAMSDRLAEVLGVNPEKVWIDGNGMVTVPVAALEAVLPEGVLR